MLSLWIPITGRICKGPISLSGHTAILKLVFWRESTGWEIHLELQCWHKKMATRYTRRSVFNLHLCFGSFRVYGVCAFFWKMQTVLRDDKDKRFSWAQAVTKSYSGQRPNVMGLNTKFEGSVETAPLSGRPLMHEWGQWTSCLYFSSLSLPLPTPSSQGEYLSGLNTHLNGFSCVQTILSSRHLLQCVRQDLELPLLQLLLSGLDSRDYLGHPAWTVLGNPCPCCSLLVQSLLNIRKEILIFWVLFFRAVTSSVVSAGATTLSLFVNNSSTSQELRGNDCPFPTTFPTSIGWWSPHAACGSGCTSRQIKLFLLHSIHFLMEEHNLVSRKGNIVVWIVVKRKMMVWWKRMLALSFAQLSVFCRNDK